MSRSIALLALLLLATGPGPSPALAATPEPGSTPAATALRDYVLDSGGRHAYGVYFEGQKMGWVVDELGLGTRNGRPVAVMTSEGRLSVRFMDARSTITMQGTTVYSLEDAGEIVFARERTVEDGSATEVEVVRSGREVVITTRTAGHESSRRAPVPQDTLDRMRQLDRWLSAERRAGDTFETFSADWAEAEVDVPGVFTFESTEQILWGGVPTRVYRVRVEMQGLRSVFTVGLGGWILKGRLGEILEIRAETEAVAKRFEEATVDMLAASSIRVDRPLGDPEAVGTLKLRVSGLGDFPLPTSHRQAVLHRDGDTATLAVRGDFRAADPVPLGPAERERSLRSTPTLQSDHPVLRKRARRILRGERDPEKAARRLAEWVFETLRQSYEANASTALQVLDNKAGDCSEHALLFVALARAAGIPAREVSGIAYVGDELQLFGWHAWAEIHDGSQWISVDPMWHQVYVDATHIKLSDDVEDLSWANVVGRLELEILEAGAETRPAQD